VPLRPKEHDWEFVGSSAAAGILELAHRSWGGGEPTLVVNFRGGAPLFFLLLRSREAPFPARGKGGAAPRPGGWGLHTPRSQGGRLHRSEGSCPLDRERTTAAPRGARCPVSAQNPSLGAELFN
jgi:hypothetical protein